MSPRHTTHRSHLGGVDPQAGDQPGHKRSSPTAIVQELRCAFQNSASVKPTSDAEETIPSQSREQFPADERTRDHDEKSGGNKDQPD